MGANQAGGGGGGDVMKPRVRHWLLSIMYQEGEETEEATREEGRGRVVVGLLPCHPRHISLEKSSYSDFI